MTVLLSEEDTKTQRITPALKKAGWPLSQIAMEYNLKADRFRIVPDQNKTYKESSRTRADYVLFHSTNVPVAVLEAKSAAKTAEEGLGQAITYAKMLDVPFAYASSGDKFVEYNLKTGQQRTIPLTAFPSPPSRRPPERATSARQKINYDNGQVTTTLSTHKTTHVIQACSLCCHCRRRPPHGLCHDQFGRNR